VTIYFEYEKREEKETTSFTIREANEQVPVIAAAPIGKIQRFLRGKRE
jgi:hypothetical protein